MTRLLAPPVSAPAADRPPEIDLGRFTIGTSLPVPGRIAGASNGELILHTPTDRNIDALSSIGHSIERGMSAASASRIRSALIRIARTEPGWTNSLDSSPPENPAELVKRGGYALFSVLAFQRDPYKHVCTVAESKVWGDRFGVIVNEWIAFTVPELRGRRLDAIDAGIEQSRVWSEEGRPVTSLHHRRDFQELRVFFDELRLRCAPPAGHLF